MVKFYLFLLLAGCLFSKAAHAGSFLAQVDRSEVSVTDTLHLKLELSDLNANSAPDLSALDGAFQVIGKEQSSMRNIINGNSSSSTTWNLTLLPVRVGTATIPAITVNTNHGELKTEPIEIAVKSDAVGTAKSANERGISFIANASKIDPFKNERILVSFKLTSRQPLRNIQLADLSVKDAIVEPQGQPKVEKEIVNGREQMALVASYLITPLKDGPLTIPALVLRGETPEARSAVPNRHSSLDSFFDDDNDPFAQMQRMMQNFRQDEDFFGGVARMKPVAITSKPLELKVLPPVPGVDPWLPASNLKLSETWSQEQARVGEPLTRTITTEVSGLSVNQVPGFEEQLRANKDFKVYADLPVVSEKSGHLGVRKENFTFIPQNPGELRLPALKVTWWDTGENRQKTASLPERVLQVLPGANGLAAAKPTAPATKSEVLISPVTDTTKKAAPYLLYVVVAMGAILAMLGIRECRIRIRRISITSVQPVTGPEIEKVGPKDLAKCDSVAAVKQFLQTYSQAYWEVPANASLAKIFAAADLKLTGFDKNKAKDLSRQMENALYAGKELDLNFLKQEIAEVLFRKGQKSNQKWEFERLPELNPS